MEGDSKSVESALDDVQLSALVPASALGISQDTTSTKSLDASSTPIQGFIHAFFNRSISSRIKGMMQRMRRSATRVVQAQLEERASMPIIGGANTSGCKPSSSNRVSSRIARMMQRRGKYASDLEFEIDSSEAHWSELHPTSDEDVNTETDLEVFQRLQKKWGAFFLDGRSLQLGEKIAEEDRPRSSTHTGEFVPSRHLPRAMW